MIRPTHFLVIAMLVILPSTDALACTCMGGGGPACQEAWGEGVSSIFLGRVAKIELTLGVMSAPDNAASMTSSGRVKIVNIAIEEIWCAQNSRAISPRPWLRKDSDRAADPCRIWIRSLGTSLASHLWRCRPAISGGCGRWDFRCARSLPNTAASNR